MVVTAVADSLFMKECHPTGNLAMSHTTRQTLGDIKVVEAPGQGKGDKMLAVRALDFNESYKVTTFGCPGPTPLRYWGITSLLTLVRSARDLERKVAARRDQPGR